MRPQNSKATRRSQGVPCARMLIKQHLNWLEGFPLRRERQSILWCRVPWNRPGAFELQWVDRLQVQRAQFALTRLEHRFPQAMAQLAANPTAWFQTQQVRLASLKPHLEQSCALSPHHFPTPIGLPTREARRLEQLTQHLPQLEPLFHAISFLETQRLEPEPKALLDWLEHHASRLLRIADECLTMGRTPRSLPEPSAALLMQLTVCILRNDFDSPATLDRCLDLLFDRALQTLRWPDPFQSVNQHRAAIRAIRTQGRYQRPTESPQATFLDVVERFLDRTLQTTPAWRAPRLNALALVSTPRIGIAAETITRIQHHEEAYFRGLYDRLERSRNLAILRRAKTEIRQLTDHRASAEVDLHLEQLASIDRWLSEIDLHVGTDRTAVRMTNAPLNSGRRQSKSGPRWSPESYSQAKFSKPWLRFIRVFPEDELAIPLKLFHGWSTRLKRCPRNAPRRVSRLTQILEALAGLLEMHGIPDSLREHWRQGPRGVTSNDIVWGLTDRWLDRDRDPDLMQLFKATLFDHDLALPQQRLASIPAMSRVLPPAQIGALLQAMDGFPDDTVHEWCLQAAWAISADPSTIAKLLQRFEQHYDLAAAVSEIVQVRTKPWLRELLVRLILSDRVALALRLGKLCSLFVYLNEELPDFRSTEANDDWMVRYPEALRSELEALHASFPDAASLAASVLAQNFPAPEKIRDEIEFLEQRIASPGIDLESESRLRKRLHRRRQILASQQTLSAQRATRLRKKLAARRDLELVERIAQHGHRRLSHEYRLLALPSDAPLLNQAHIQLVFGGLLQLKSPFRERGMSLFRAGVLGQTLSPLDDEKNRAFVSRISRQGIDLQPWLSGYQPLAVKTRSGDTYTVAFTDKPFDYLLMGHHFQTCLSPQQENFFSTISNAYDVNKRVLYARTRQGRIVGRCLVALTDEGELVSFNRYSTEGRFEFSNAVDRYLVDLAAAMQTRVVGRRPISQLTLPEWYDDHAVAVTEVIRRDDLFQALPEQLSAGQVPQARLSFLSLARRYDASEVAKLVLDLPELKPHGELIAEIYDRSVEQTQNLAGQLEMTYLAWQGGVQGSAERFLLRLKTPEFIRKLRRESCSACGIIHLSEAAAFELPFKVIDPTNALRALRGFRRKGIKTDRDETAPPLIKLLAGTHERLGRHRLAEELRLKLPT